MSATISVTFYARQSRSSSDGLTPIFMRVKLGKDHFDTNTKLYVNAAQWSSDFGKMKGVGEEAKRINALLEAFKIKAFDLQRELMQSGKVLTLQVIKNKWFGVSTERPRMLLEIFEHHNQQMKALVEREDFAPLTLERYVTSKKHTQSFLKWKHALEDIDIRDLNYEFITDYEFWLKSVRRCSHNTSMKYLSNFKKIINICIKNSWLSRDPFFGYKLTKEEIEKDFLSSQELQRITSKTFASDRLALVRDIFLFSCYTGLAYADVKKLHRNEIVIGIDGEKWVSIHRQKNKNPSKIPILSPAQAILDRYSNHPKCLNEGRLLPILSNQKMNSYLKEIADLTDITKQLTYHIARHTFATTVTLSNGVPIETVGKMLGHKNLKTTQHYAKILDKKVSDDMMALRKIFQAEKARDIKSNCS